jgi:DNA-binding protein YbaB
MTTLPTIYFCFLLFIVRLAYAFHYPLQSLSPTKLNLFRSSRPPIPTENNPNSNPLNKLGGFNFVEGMKKAQEMMKKMEEIQKSLGETVVTHSDPTGMIQVSFTGTGVPVKVSVNDNFLSLTAVDASTILSDTLKSGHASALHHMELSVKDMYASLGLPNDPAIMDQFSKALGN